MCAQIKNLLFPFVLGMQNKDMKNSRKNDRIVINKVSVGY